MTTAIQFKTSTHDGYKPPETPEQLKSDLWNLFGIRIPDKKVCENHVAPFTAFCDAFFGVAPVLIWWASRGFGGKSTMLATLALMELMSRMRTTVLGGSAEQSKTVHEKSTDIWDAPVHEGEYEGEEAIWYPPMWALKKEPTIWSTTTIWNNWMRVLTASTRSVRGPHPERLKIDEADEVPIKLIDAALGQTMESEHGAEVTVISSTLQYANGPMAEILERAAAKGQPVYQWCYRETLEPHGWLRQSQVDTKRATVTQDMWDTEYELNEPETEGLAFQRGFVDLMFDTDFGYVEDKLGEEYIFEEPMERGEYVTAADWAKEQDETVISTWRYDVDPPMLIAFERTNREPWPNMVNKFNDRVRRYPGRSIHDATGVGNVVSDYLEVPDVEDFVITGMNKKNLFTNYIVGVEQESFVVPYIKSAVGSHQKVGTAAFYGGSTEHTPDDIVSFALAWGVINGHIKKPKKKTGRLLRPRTL